MPDIQMPCLEREAFVTGDNISRFYYCISLELPKLRDCLTSRGSISLAMEGERERDLRCDLGSSSRDGVLEGVKLSIEST